MEGIPKDRGANGDKQGETENGLRTSEWKPQYGRRRERRRRKLEKGPKMRNEFRFTNHAVV